jgi:hypothetical protein
MLPRVRRFNKHHQPQSTWISAPGLADPPAGWSVKSPVTTP